MRRASVAVSGTRFPKIGTPYCGRRASVAASGTRFPETRSGDTWKCSKSRLRTIRRTLKCLPDTFLDAPGSREALFPTCLQARGRQDFAGTLCLQGTRVLQGVQGLNPGTCQFPELFSGFRHAARLLWGGGGCRDRRRKLSTGRGTTQAIVFF